MHRQRRIQSFPRQEGQPREPQAHLLCCSRDTQ